ncbi:MAG: hypothetical protein EOM06_14150, partial [Sphingobacteriia bacterium]|nr:hypothetical protein [Sphingobacteriia bacterium]
TFYTGLRVEPSKWSFEQQRVKRNVAGGSDINDILNMLSEKAVKYLRQSKLKGTEPTTEQLKNVLSAAIGKQSSVSDFFQLFDKFVSSEAKLKSWSKGTIDRFTTVKNHLLRFNKQLNINDIDPEALVSFFHQSGLRNSTAQKQIKILQWFLNWCEKSGYVDKVKKLKVDLKASQHRVIFLSMDEIRTLANLELEGYLDDARNVFIFQCLSGIRYSDLRNLKAADVNSGAINISTVKTGENIKIQLTKTTAGILQKYHELQAATGRALPVPTNQVFNKFIKQLCKKAKFDEPITLVYYKGNQRVEVTKPKHELVSSHTGRRSFITVGLTAGIQSEVIRSWTGHTSDDSFKQYYEIVKERQLVDIKKFEL